MKFCIILLDSINLSLIYHVRREVSCSEKDANKNNNKEQYVKSQYFQTFLLVESIINYISNVCFEVVAKFD